MGGGRRRQARAKQREGRTPDEVAYDYLAESADRFLFFPVVNYNQDNLGVLQTMLEDTTTLLGLSDGGAHCSSIIDASRSDEAGPRTAKS